MGGARKRVQWLVLCLNLVYVLLLIFTLFLVTEWVGVVRGHGHGWGQETGLHGVHWVWPGVW